MSEPRPPFTRADLERAAVTREFELEDAEVESVSRTLERRLADRADRLATFRDEADATRAPGATDRSAADARTERRLSAVLGREPAGAVPIEYKPYGPHGAMAMLIGGIFALPSVFVTLLTLVPAGYYLYRIERSAEVPLRRVIAVDVLVDGSTDSGAVRVTVAAEPGLAVDADRLSGIDWPLRKAIVVRVRDWTEAALETESGPKTADDVFFDHVDMWWKRDPETDVDRVDSLQRELARDREARSAYASLLRERSDPSSDVDRSDADSADRTDSDPDGGRVDAVRELEALLDGLADAE